MVATTEEKSKPISGNKVSKPLMEKKRRARINQCLDQLKSLLENYYSSSIRKRKLEKADILELTVKHLRNLQKIQSFTAAASELSEYHSGFRTCLANVNQYLLMADSLNGSDRWMLTQLSNKLCRSRRGGDVSSTLDSGLEPSEAREEARKLLPSAAGPEEGKTVRSKALKRHSANSSPFLPSEDKHAAPRNTNENSSSHNKKVHSVSHRHEAANTQHSVWRPW
ncbi:hairy-related 3 [Acanthochromis polyacanthus]|nr:hairy-related 3 [Acanthochromis polyacanthus]